MASTYAVPVIYQHQPIYKTLVKQVEYDAPAEYTFSYSVHDDHTGDIKSQEESRKGDDVHGQYSLIDGKIYLFLFILLEIHMSSNIADGYRRVVQYTADEKNGFQAIVTREPVKGVKIVQPVAHKLVAAPIHHYVAPAIAHKVIAAPIAHKVVSHGAATVSIDAHGVKTVY